MPVYYIAVVNREGDVRFRRESFTDLYAAEGHARQIAPIYPIASNRFERTRGTRARGDFSKVWKAGDLRG